jgi:hypothetical protein
MTIFKAVAIGIMIILIGEIIGLVGQTQVNINKINSTYQLVTIK